MLNRDGALWRGRRRWGRGAAAIRLDWLNAAGQRPRELPLARLLRSLARLDVQASGQPFHTQVGRWLHLEVAKRCELGCGAAARRHVLG